MTNKKTKLKFMAVAVLVAGMAASQLTGFAAQAANKPARGQWAAQRFNRVATVLDLTDAQKTQAKTIFDSARQSAQPVMSQLKQNRKALQAVVKSGNDADLQKLATEQGNLVAQLVTIRTRAAQQFYAMLTPQQREKADQLHGFMMRGMHRGARAQAHSQAGGSQ